MIDAFETLFSSYSPGVQEISHSIRKLIQKLLPGATEKITGWNNAAYGSGDKMYDMKIIIIPLKSYVNLEFTNGIALPDPKKLLEGTGKRMRHVKITSLNQATNPAIAALIKAAWKTENEYKMPKAGMKTKAVKKATRKKRVK